MNPQPVAPDKLLAALLAITPRAALQAPQLSALRKADPAALVQALIRLLVYVRGMFNFAENKTFTAAQVSLLANELLADYWMLKFDEVAYVLRQGAKGKYHTFDRLDAGVVHGWFSEYLAEREALVAQARQEEARQHKLAEQATRTTRFDNEQAFRRHLETLTDEQLEQGIAYYQQRPEAELAAVRVELAAQVLLDRKKITLLRSVVEQPTDQDGFVTYEEVSEEEYRRHRAAWVAQGGSAIGAEVLPQTEEAA